MEFTSNNITKLKENEIFVFGSNKLGNHIGGAARTAVEKFGAVMGQAEGLQGQSYAIPTLDDNMNKVRLDELQASFETFAEFANEHKEKTFYLTKVGCGIAGFTEDEIIEVLNKVELPRNVIIPEDFNVIYSYKAFDKDMKCRGFQFEEGMSYEEKKAIACKYGFHACKNPFNVLDYYPLIDNEGNFSRFAQVVQSGAIDDSEQGKICSSKIKIKTEIGFPGFVKACVEWIKEKTSSAKLKGDDESNSARIGSSGYSAKIGSSGNYAQIGSSGNYARIGSSGEYAQIGSSGNYAQIGSGGEYAKIGSSSDSARIGSSGYSAKIGSSGNYAQIGSSGNYAQIGSSGEYAKIGSSGYSAKIGSSGNYAQIGSSGDHAKIGSSGNYAQIGSSGNYAQIGSSSDSARIGSGGEYAKIGSSGYSAKIGSSGNSAIIDSTGEDSVICCAGGNSMVKASLGSWITLSEWEYSEEKKRSIPICVKTEYVDGERIKADTWYKLVDGEFVEPNEDL